MKENGQMDVVMGGKGISFAGADGFKDLKMEAAVEMHNKAVDTYTKHLEANIKSDLEKAQEVTERMQSMEIMPSGMYILCKPYAKNPYQKIEVTNSGLVIPEYTGKFLNPDTGEMDQEEMLTIVASVLEVGPLVKYIREGDDIYYRKHQGVPVPFFRQGLEVVAETQVQVIINSGLKERFKNLKEK